MAASNHSEMPALRSVVGYIHSVAEGVGMEPGDAALIDQFVRTGDEQAFEALILRHGSMVLNVCRRVLSQAADVEDAFQATFLVLSQQANAIRNRSAVASWLYGVAHRIAQRARSDAGRRKQHEHKFPKSEAMNADENLEQQELRLILEEELYRLPQKYQDPLVLCYLKSKTHQQAAAELGWTIGTVSGRLSRARDMLRQRLKQRGIVLSTAALISIISSTAVAVPAALIPATVGICTGQNAVTPGAMALAKGGLPTMLSSKLSITCALLVTIALMGTGATLMQSTAQQPTQPKRLSRQELLEKIIQLQEQLQQSEAKRLKLKLENDQLRALRHKEKQQSGGADAIGNSGGAANSKLSPKQMISARYLQKLARALNAYADANGAYPTAAITTQQGKPLLSWRVALLPYLGHGELYKQFKLDEPWNSKHNKNLLLKMPQVYGRQRVPNIRIPPEKLYVTPYQAVNSGKESIFRKAVGVKRFQIFDGTANTILLMESNQLVPWTQPIDKPMITATTATGMALGKGFLMAMAAGTVRWVPAGRADIQKLYHLSTWKGGEPQTSPAYPTVKIRPSKGGR